MYTKTSIFFLPSVVSYDIQTHIYEPIDIRIYKDIPIALFCFKWKTRRAWIVSLLM